MVNFSPTSSDRKSVTNDLYSVMNNLFIIYQCIGVFSMFSPSVLSGWNWLVFVHFFFARTKKKLNQRKNSPAVAKKLKIEVCFSKRAKRPRFARLTRLVLNAKHLQFSSRLFAKRPELKR